ncbi:hypothetical protein EDD86DRAFT_173194, partial [Gorgonomyces haynaldii]
TSHDLLLVVEASKALEPGSRIKIPQTGAEIGRDYSFEPRLRLKDELVTGFHGQVGSSQFLRNNQISYNTSMEFMYGFYIVDFGSKFGTFINDIRISTPNMNSPPVFLAHGDRVQIGSTLMRVHLHERGFCEDCSGGVFMGVTSGVNKQVVITKGKRAHERRPHEQKDLTESLRRLSQQSKQIQKTYTPKSRQHIHRRPDKRRNGEPEVSVEPKDRDKGMMLLKKLGWSGQGLGKEEQGIKEPIAAHMNQGRRGLG